MVVVVAMVWNCVGGSRNCPGIGMNIVRVVVSIIVNVVK